MASCTAGSLLGYEEPAELDKYLQEFKSAADERGYKLKIPDKFKVKLVEKVDGNSTTKGFCIEDIPMVIRLEKKYWMEADLTQQKILLFHEFGHCFLDRTHTNEVLPNGEWKSLMRGGKLPENRSYVINFRGFRKQYYWDELFTPDTSIPSWAARSEKLDIDVHTFTNMINRNGLATFFTNWVKPDTAHANYDLVNASYAIKNISDKNLAVTSIHIPYKSTGSFVIDSKVSLTLSEDEDEDGIGILFGKPDSLEYLAITPKLGIKLGNLYEFRPYTTIPLNANSTNQDYRITVQNKQHELLYYINEDLVYHTSSKPFAADSLFVGFYVAPNSALKIKNIKIMGK